MYRQPLRCTHSISSKFKIGTYYDGVWQDPNVPREPDEPRPRCIVEYRGGLKEHGCTPHRDRVTCEIGFGGTVSKLSKFGTFECNDSCDHNNHTALMMRLASNPIKQEDGSYVQGTYPESDPGTVAQVAEAMKAIAREFLRVTPGKPLTMEEFIEALHARDEGIATQMKTLGFKTKASNTALYEQMLEETREAHPKMPSDHYPAPQTLKRYAKIKNFAKVEVLDPKKYPRNISPRHPRFNLVLGCFIKPIEAFVMGMDGSGNLREWFPGNTPLFRNVMVGKCYNKAQRGILLQNKIDLFIEKWGVHPLILSTDCSGFDSHCTKSMIKEEWHSLISKCYPRYKHYLRELGEYCIENEGMYGANRWKLSGGRMSGDMHTGAGNCWIVASILMAYFREARRCRTGIDKRWDCCIDGDDALVFIHPSDFEYVQKTMPEFYLRCGHELKLEKVAKSIFEVEWCQSKFIRVKVEKELVDKLINKKGQMALDGEIPIAVQDPNKVFMSIGSHIHMREVQDAWAYVVANCRAYATVYSGIPVLGKLDRIGNSDRQGLLIQSGLFHSLGLGATVKQTQTQNTVYDFCNAFGYDTAMIRSAEQTMEEVNGLADFTTAFKSRAIN